MPDRKGKGEDQGLPPTPGQVRAENDFVDFAAEVKKKMPESKKPEPPKVIRILENKTLAHGSGLIPLRVGQRVDDPWIIHAVLANNVDHAVSE